MRYRREIDGLRAVAVVPVILYHAGFGDVPGGFVGVDVFFVLSGYLITSILAADLEADRFSILRFYERRARRILPALVLVTLCAVPVAWAVLLPHELRDFGWSVVAVAGFVSNVLFWSRQDYFAGDADLQPLLHTWSLAVEEQFYLLFPPLLWLLWRLGPRRAAWALAGLAALSLGLAEWGWRSAPSANFYLAPFRAWELLAGSLCAFALRGRDPWSGGAASLLGLAMIAAAVLLFDRTTPDPSLAMLLPVGGTALVILFAAPGTPAARLLGLPPLVGIGLVSYGAYLWHQPILAFARLASDDPPGKIAMLGLALSAFPLAWLSWRFVETPFRTGPRLRLPNRAQLLGAAGAATFALGAVGVAVALTAGLRAPPAPAFVAAGEWELASIDNGWCFWSVNTLPDLPVGEEGLGCRLGQATSGPRAMLFGDSFAAQYEPLWAAVSDAVPLRMTSVTTNWCFPSAGTSFPGPAGDPSERQCAINRRHLLESLPDLDLVVLGGAWSGVEAAGMTPEVVDLVTLILARSEARVVVMPSPQLFRRRSVERRVLEGAGALVPNGEEEGRVLAAEAAFAAQDWPQDRVVLVPREDLFGPAADGLAPDGTPFSLDGAHVSIHGAREAAGIFLGSASFRRVADLAGP